MEKEKKLCPHCGKENDEGNLFCGYCGKSLSSTEVIAEKNEDNADIDEEAQAIESIPEIHPRKLNLKINPISFSLFIIILVAFFILPSEVRHKKEIKEALIEMSKEKVNSNSVFKDVLIKNMVENSINIEIKNYYLFAIGEISFKEYNTLYPIKASIALFGKVFIILDKDRLTYKATEGGFNDTTTTDEYTDSVYRDDDYIEDYNGEETESFSELMKTADWIKSEYCNFMVPTFFIKGESVSVENGSCSIDRYYYGNTEICCGMFGCNDIEPYKGMELSKNVFINNITYHSKKKNIYSGYVNDGRIYYMKMSAHFTDWGEGIGHTDMLFLAVISPEKYKKAVTPIINMIKDWQ